MVGVFLQVVVVANCLRGALPPVHNGLLPMEGCVCNGDKLPYAFALKEGGGGGGA